MFNRKRSIIFIISICFLSLLAGYVLGIFLPLNFLEQQSRVIIYEERETILEKTKYYKIINIEQIVWDNLVNIEDIEKHGFAATIFIDLPDCVSQSFIINYLALQGTTEDIPGRATYIYVDFIDQMGFITTEKFSIAGREKNEYGKITIKIPGDRKGFNEEENAKINELRRKLKNGIFNKQEWEAFLTLVKPKLICKPQKTIKTIWLSE